MMDRYVFAIDPGNIQSGYALIKEKDFLPFDYGKVENNELLEYLEEVLFQIQNDKTHIDVCIEMVAHYGTGMPAGKEIFDTCVWIGRFMQVFKSRGMEPVFIYRREEKLHLCGSVTAKDSNIIQALIDRFAPNTPNRGKGTKKAPGFFYGFKADVWQAYAVGVTYIDKYIGKAEGQKEDRCEQ